MPKFITVDGLAQAHHRLHVVLDQHDGDALLVAHAPHELGHAPRPSEFIPVKGSSSSMSFRPAASATAMPRCALMTVRQVGGKLAREIAQAEQLEDVVRLTVRCIFSGAVATEDAAEETGLGDAVTAEPDIVEHGELVKQRGALEGPDQPSSASALVS